MPDWPGPSNNELDGSEEVGPYLVFGDDPQNQAAPLHFVALHKSSKVATGIIFDSHKPGV